jgi:hypothetical protein
MSALQRLESELRTNMRERPYWTTAMLVGVGWVIGRTLPMGALFAIAGLGARTALMTSLESAVVGQVRPFFERQDQEDSE